MNNIDFMKLDPSEFENLAMDYVQCVFGEDCTSFVHTPLTHDGGKDIVITSINKITNYKTWVECKRHNRNIGLDEIGKNVVLIISHRINKLIFISASEISKSAKSEILNVSSKNNFDILFLDGDTLKRELLKYPSLLSKYFSIHDNIPTDNTTISFELYLSEFDNEFDISTDELFVLERDNCFYANILISNHTENALEEMTWKIDTSYSGIVILSNPIVQSEVNPHSDATIQFFCYCSSFKNKVYFPNVLFSYTIGKEENQYTVQGRAISLEHILKVPLSGKRVTEFLLNEWASALEIIQKKHAQFVLVYGGSGTGKTRILEEMDISSKKTCFLTKYIDCKSKTNVYILKKLLSFIMEVPFDKIGISYSEEDIYRIVENEYGSVTYAEVLCDLFVKDTLAEKSIYYIKNALLTFICHSRSGKPHIVFLDNIQQCDNLIKNIITELMDSLQYKSAPFALIASLNTETIEDISNDSSAIISSYKDKQHDTNNYIYSYEAKEFDATDARLFWVNLLGSIDSNDPLIDILMDKAGLRPFEIIMQYKYLRDRNILIINNTSRIPEIRNYSELVKCIPPSVDELISRRWRQINKDIPKDEWIECEKIVKCLIAFYNKIPSFFIDDVIFCRSGKKILLDKLIIKYDRYSNSIEFYHDNLYRFFRKNEYYSDIGTVGFDILFWLKNNEEIELDNREKIVFFCYINTGQLSKGLEYGINLANKYHSSFDFRSAHDICDVLSDLAKERMSTSEYFHFCYIYARSSWETVNIYKTLKIYELMHSYVYPFNSEISIDELCLYYRDFINAYSHAGLYNKIERLLMEFDSVPNCPKEYQFVVKNRANVFYMRTKNFTLANESGLEAYSIAKELKNNFMLSTACSDIAFNYLYNKKDFKSAKMYFEEAILTYEKDSDTTYYRELEIHNQKAIVHYIDKEYDSAINELEISVSKSHRMQNKYMEAKALNYMGIIYIHQSNYVEANNVWTKALRINESLGNIASVITVYINMSSMNLLKKDYIIALDLTQKALELLNDDSNQIEKNDYFNPLFYNYIVSCYYANKTDAINHILLDYPEYKTFYCTITKTSNIENYLCSEYMNYYGKAGYSFL